MPGSFVVRSLTCAAYSSRPPRSLPLASAAGLLFRVFCFGRRSLGLIVVLGLICGSSFGEGQYKTTKKTKVAPQAPVSVPSAASLSPAAASQLASALKMVQSGQYQAAVPLLYSLSRRSEFEREKMQIKYILGSALMDLGLNQIAAFQFVEVIKNGNSHYVRQAIEKLSLAADQLGDDTLLNYAVSRIKIEDIPAASKDLIYFRLGEVKLKAGQLSQALDLFGRVPEGSRYFFLSRVNKGLALLEEGKPQEAISTYKALVGYRANAYVTDTNRVVAQLGLARAYYQATDWENSIATYREIPRDHPLWHEALFESSWALVRAARFRSALSNFQSLHSAYYEDFFLPESLLLRSIVYLYVCKYDEMAKVLDLFEKTYGPIRAQMSGFMSNNSDPVAFYNEVDQANNIRLGRPGRTKLPLKVDNQILHEGDVKRAFAYLKILNDEKNKLDSMPNISRSPMGAVGRKILGNRYKNAKIFIGEMTKAHLLEMRAELKDQYEQASFIRYEMINGEKEVLKKRIAGKDAPKVMLNDNIDRSVYAQNGYEYWPFDGEYWLDEIGNYHYLGNQSCE